MIFEGSVKPLINLIPSSSVALIGRPGETKSMDLSISAGLDKPLILKPVKFSLEGKVSYSMETIEEGKLYKINFQNNPDTAGYFEGYLRLSTNYKEKPEIRIRIFSRFNK